MLEGKGGKKKFAVLGKKRQTGIDFERFPKKEHGNCRSVRRPPKEGENLRTVSKGHGRKDVLGNRPRKKVETSILSVWKWDAGNARVLGTRWTQGFDGEKT